MNIVAFGSGVVAATFAQANEPSVHLECSFRSVAASPISDAQTHHIRIDYVAGEISDVTGPSPTCAAEATEYEISDDQIVWSCVDAIASGQVSWVGYINRFTSRYDIRAKTLRDGQELEFIMRGECIIAERQF